MRSLLLALLTLTGLCFGSEQMDLDVISYEAFISEEPNAMETLKSALFEKGIVGIRGIPGFREKVSHYIETARQFNAFPDAVKEKYAPLQQGKVTDLFLGYMAGREKFQLKDGRWVVDDLKVSYYAYVPDHPENRWPLEIDLQTPYLRVAEVMADMGEAVMTKVGLLGPKSGITLDGAMRLGRMLYYKSAVTETENEYWCGNHFDHGMFTALLPAFYFQDGKPINEPEEAGLFVNADGTYRKVVADDPDVLLFQVGEFGQLAMNDEITATEHRVHKSLNPVERYTVALFFCAPAETVIHSTSKLANDSRYGAQPGEACTYAHWDEASYRRYIVEE